MAPTSNMIRCMGSLLGRTLETSLEKTAKTHKNARKTAFKKMRGKPKKSRKSTEGQGPVRVISPCKIGVKSLFATRGIPCICARTTFAQLLRKKFRGPVGTIFALVFLTPLVGDRDRGGQISEGIRRDRGLFLHQFLSAKNRQFGRSKAAQVFEGAT